MTPAAVVSTLVKLEGMDPAVTKLKQYDRLGRKAAASGDRFTSATRAQGKAVQGTTKHLSSAVKVVGSLVGAYGAYRIVKSAVTDTMALAGATMKLTAITGMDAKETSKWIELFKARGVGIRAVSVGFITLSRNMRNAMDGSAKAADAFKELGISQDTIRRGNVEEVILQTADSFKKMKNPAERAALAQQIFGRQSQSLIPLLSQGRDAVIDALDAVERYGAYLPKNMDQLKKMRKAQFEWNYAMDGMKIALATGLLPALLPAITAIENFIADMRAGKGVGGAFGDVLSAIWGGIKNAAGVIGGVFDYIKQLVGLFREGNPYVVAFTGALVGMTAALVALTAINKAKAAIHSLELVLAALGGGVIGIAVVAIAALVGALVMLYLKVPAVRAVLQAMWEWMKGAATDVANWVVGAVGTMVSAFTSAAGWIITAWTNATNGIKSVWTSLTTWISNAWDAVVAALGPTVQNLGIIFSSVFSVIRAVATPVLSAIVFGFEALKAIIGPVANILGTYLAGAFRVAWAAASSVAKVLGAILVPAFEGAWEVVKSVATGLWQVVKGAFDIIRGIIAVFAGLFTLDFTKMWNGIKQIFGGAVKALVGILSGIGGALRAAATGVMNMLSSGITAAWSGIKKVFNTIIDSFVDVVTSFGKAMWNAGKGLFTAIWNGMKSVAQWVLDRIFDFIKEIVKIINIIPGVNIKPPEAPKLAQGGVVQAAQKGAKITKPMAIVGEEAPRHPEYVVPTNPAYRSNALGLFSSLGKELHVPGFASGGMFTSTAYGPPWGGIQGSGVTRTGIDLRRSPQAYIVAVDPNVIRLGSKMRIQPNPFSYSGDFAAEDTGGAIKGNRIDFYDWLGRAHQEAWGVRNVTVQLESGSFLTDALGFLENVGVGMLKTMIPGLGAVETAADLAVKLIGKLPGIPKLPDWIQGLPSYMLGKAKDFITGKSKEVMMQSGQLGDLSPVWKAIDAIASRYGLTITSSRPSGPDHWQHDYSNSAGYGPGSQTPQELAFARAVASNYGSKLFELIHTPLGYGIKNGHRVGLSYWGAENDRHYNHVHVAFKKGGVLDWAGAFGSGGAVTATSPTLAMFGEHGPETAMFLPHFQTGGVWTGNRPAWQMSPGTVAAINAAGTAGTATSGLPDVGTIIGLPALPNIPGAIPNTIPGANKLANQVDNLRSQIDSLESDFTNLDQYYNLNTLELNDPTTGKVDTGAKAERINQLTNLLAIRQKVFDLWGQVVVLSDRLVKAYQKVVANLQGQLKEANTTLGRLQHNVSWYDSQIAGLQNTYDNIHTAGLKGPALTSAQRHKEDLRTKIQTMKHERANIVGERSQAEHEVSRLQNQVQTYQGKIPNAKDQAAAAANDRVSAWISKVGSADELENVRKVLDIPQETTTAPGPTAVETQYTEALQTALTQARQETLAAQAFQSAFTSALAGKTAFTSFGMYAGGGTAPQTGWALVGEKGPEFAWVPRGTRIYPNNSPPPPAMEPTFIIKVEDGAVNADRIRVIAVDSANDVFGAHAGATRGTPSSPGRVAKY